MSDTNGAETRWLAPMSPEERRLMRANEEIYQARLEMLAARRQRVAANSAAIGGSPFQMSGSAMHKAYADLHEQYTKVVSLRTELQANARRFRGEALGGQITGVVAAGQLAQQAVQQHLVSEALKVEKELVVVLNGMYGSYHGSAATDRERGAAMRAAGSSGGGAPRVQ